LGLDWLKYVLKHDLPLPPLIFKVPNLQRLTIT